MNYGMNIIGAATPLTPDEAMLASVVHGYESGQFGAEIIGQAMPIASRVLQQAGSRPGTSGPLLQRYQAAAQRVSPMAAIPTATPGTPGGALAVPASLGPIREVGQGVDSVTNVAAGASASITINVTMAFRPTRLMVGPAVAPLFIVDNLRVGPDSLFLGATGSIPAEAFLPGAVNAPVLKRKTAQGGTPVICDVTNLDAVAHRFRAALFGEGADVAACG